MSAHLFRCTDLRPSVSEICRYLGLRGKAPDPALEALIRDCSAVLAEITGRVCYRTLPLASDGSELRFGGELTLHSGALARNLRGCDRAVLFCATLGAAFDRRLLSARLQPSRAVVLDAVGTAAIERLCDTFCNTLPEKQRPRFSPGYGDLPLETQPPLLALLQAERLLGVGLTDSLLMTPAKSVTAIVGLSNREDVL